MRYGTDDQRAQGERPHNRAPEQRQEDDAIPLAAPPPLAHASAADYTAAEGERPRTRAPEQRQHEDDAVPAPPPAP